MKTNPDTTSSCDYHPNKTAAEKCDTCEKMICLDCVREVSIPVKGKRGGNYEIHKRVCPICYCNHFINQEPTEKKILTVVLSIFALFFLIFELNLEGRPSILLSFAISFICLPLCGVMYLIYYLLIRNPSIKRKYEAEKAKFLLSLTQDEPIHHGAHHHHTKKGLTGGQEPAQTIHCQQCGAENLISNRTCVQCGKSLAGGNDLPK